MEFVAIKNNMSSYLQNTFTLVSENFGNIFFVLLSIKEKLKRMNKSKILNFIAFYKTSQFV